MASAQHWIDLATKLISKFGRVSDVTFTRDTLSVYNPVTLQQVEGTATTYTLPGAPVDFNIKEINGTTILQGQKKLYIPGGTSYTPIVGDNVALGSDVYRVLNVTVFETQSVNCAYLLQIGV